MTSSTPRRVSSKAMADALCIDVKTLLRMRADTTRDAFLVEGTHYRAQTPKSGSPWIWDQEATLSAWDFACKRSAKR
jgi:hypothetical protein